MDIFTFYGKTEEPITERHEDYTCRSMNIIQNHKQYCISELVYNDGKVVIVKRDCKTGEFKMVTL